MADVQGGGRKEPSARERFPSRTGLSTRGSRAAAVSSAFDIFDSATESELARRFYDENGNLVRRVRHDSFASGQLSNPLTGAALDYTQTQKWTDILAVPGDLGSATVTLTGEFVVHGAKGAAVLVGAGRTVFAPDFTIEFQAGPSGFLDLIALDPSAVGPLCAALATT